MAPDKATVSDTTTSPLYLLKSCPLFSSLSDKELGSIFAMSRVIPMDANQTIPTASTEEPALWILKRGYASMKLTDEDGHQITVIILQPGDVFGALHPGDDERYGDSYKTVTSVCLCRLTLDKLNTLMAEHPHVAFSMVKSGFQRTHRLQVRLADLMMRPVESRLAFVLLELEKIVGEDAGGSAGRALKLPLSHFELAQLIGASREMVTHVLKRLRKEGLVSTEDRQIRLLDIESLEWLRDGKYEWSGN